MEQGRLLGCHAAVDHQFGAGDPGCFVGRQEQDAVGDVLGGAGDRYIGVRSISCWRTVGSLKRLSVIGVSA